MSESVTAGPEERSGDARALVTITITYIPERRWNAANLLDPVLAALAAQGINPESTEAWLSGYSNAAASAPEDGLVLWQTHRSDGAT